MKLSNIEPLEPLREALIEAGLTDMVYVNNKPSSGLPQSYVELHINGGIRTDMSQMGMVKGFILIGINVRILSTGGRNVVKEKIILQKFDELFKNNRSLKRDGYTYSLDPKNIVFQGGGLYEGYTTKIINLTYKK